jgi:hypothetical protein
MYELKPLLARLNVDNLVTYVDATWISTTR